MDIATITRATKTRHLKRTNTLKSSNFSMDLDTLKAYSYGWWLFCTKLDGAVIFNNTHYSPSTCKHQNKAYRVLDYKANLTLRHTRKNLTDLKTAFENELANVQAKISSLEALIAKPRTHKAKNIERRADISKLLEHSKLVNNYLTKVV